MKKLVLIIMAGILILTRSCFYAESDVYFVDVVPGDPPVFSVAVNLDTIVEPEVVDSLEIWYGAEIENGEFYLAQAFVSNSVIFQSDSLQNSFWLYPGDVPYPGVDTLYVSFYYSTNSNSLADIVKLEANIVQRKYAVSFN
jgi:hypothetical protein